MLFVKRFKDMIPEQVHVLLIGVFSATYVLFQVGGLNRVLPLLGALLSTLSVAFIVIYLALKKDFFLAYLILFLLVFSNFIRDFIINITLFWMDGFTHLGNIDAELIIGMMICLYLVVVLISFGLDRAFKLYKPSIEHIQLYGLYFVFLYLNNGFGSVLFMAIILNLLIGTGIKLLPLLIIFSQVVIAPIDAIDRIVVLGNGLSTTLFNYLMVVLATVVLVFVIKVLLKIKNNKEIELEEA